MDSFPYNIDFSPWLYFDDNSRELIDIEESGLTVDLMGAFTPRIEIVSYIVKLTIILAPNTINNSLVILGMLEVSIGPKSIGNIKILIEDSFK